MTLLLVFIVFVLLLLLQVPISFVLGMTSIFYILISGNIELVASAPQRLYSGLESYSLLAIPLFMFAGELMNSGGITRRLVQFSRAGVGHFRGGLAYVNILSNMILASIIGSATAQIAMMSRTMVDPMEKEGYKRSFATITTAFGGLLGPIIPPSMMFIIYGISSGTSIGAMFLAGILPGILLGLGFILLIAYLGWKKQWPTTKKVGKKELLQSSFRVIPALLVPGIIIVGILSGIFTPTESAAVACVLALLVGLFFYRELKIKELPQVLVNTVMTTATITMLIAMANLFGWILSFEQIPQSIAQWMGSLTDSPLVFLLVVNIFLLLVGMVLDGIAALIILVPILLPIALTFGIDPIHFGVVICLNLAIGLLTPPVGAGLYVASGITKVKIETLVKESIPFLAVSFVVLLVITYVPGIVMWIPNLMKQ